MDKAKSQDSPARTSATNEGEALIEQLLALIGGSGSPGHERRQRDRYPIYCKMVVVPMDECGQPLAGDRVTVFGKDLSRRGISFSHDLPLASKRLIVSFLLTENRE